MFGGTEWATTIRSLIRTDCEVITHVRSFVYREQHRQNSRVKWIKFATKVFWRHFNPSRQRGRRREEKSRRYNWGAMTWVGSHLRHCSTFSTPSFPRCSCNMDNRARLRNPKCFLPAPRQCLAPRPWLSDWSALLMFLVSLSRAPEYLVGKVYFKTAPFWRCWW